jgi:hypothetical protein
MTMTLYDFLKTVVNTRVFISYKGETITIYTNAIEYISDELKEAEVEKWSIQGNQSINVTLVDPVPSG